MVFLAPTKISIQLKLNKYCEIRLAGLWFCFLLPLLKKYLLPVILTKRKPSEAEARYKRAAPEKLDFWH